MPNESPSGSLVGLPGSGVTEEVLDLGDVRVGLRRTSGRGHPLVMFHGLMDSAESWDPFARSVSRPTLAFDLPGFGRSSVAGDDLDQWQDLFSDVFDVLQVDRFFLLGHSLGAALASSLAGAHEESTRGLMLIAPAGYGRIPLAQLLARRDMEFLLGLTAPEAMRSRILVGLVYRNLFSNNHGLSDGLMRRLVASRRRMVPGIRNAMHILRELSRDPFTANAYGGPVSALWGERDRLVPPARSQERLLEVFPQANELTLKDIGHHPQEECPEEALKWISEWSESNVIGPLNLADNDPAAV
ncbi:MAG: alpha/beta hydrolase [Solirubrobacterales bacterium]